MLPLTVLIVWLVSGIPVALVLGRLLGSQSRELCAQTVETYIHPLPTQSVEYADHGVYFQI